MTSMIILLKNIQALLPQQKNLMYLMPQFRVPQNVEVQAVDLNGKKLNNFQALKRP